MKPSKGKACAVACSVLQMGFPPGLVACMKLNVAYAEELGWLKVGASCTLGSVQHAL